MLALQSTLEQHLNNRELAVWGTGISADMNVGFVSSVHPISFFISNDASEKSIYRGRPVINLQGITPCSHYVVILVSVQYSEIRTLLCEMGYKKYVDYYDFFEHFYKPFDWEIKNVPNINDLGNYRNISIGKYSYTSQTDYQFLGSIGRFSSISGNVAFVNNHVMNMISTADFEYFARELFTQEDECDFYKSKDIVKNFVDVGNDVWIGRNACINSSKVKCIGDGAIIGTNALVMEDVPPYAVVYGQPAKIHRYRFDSEQIEILKSVKWWDWDNEKIRQNAKMLIHPHLFFEHFKNAYENKENVK